MITWTEAFLKLAIYMACHSIFGFLIGTGLRFWYNFDPQLAGAYIGAGIGGVLAFYYLNNR